MSVHVFYKAYSDSFLARTLNLRDNLLVNFSENKVLANISGSTVFHEVHAWYNSNMFVDMVDVIFCIVFQQVTVVSKCQEFMDIQLRTNEKRTLNTLNRDKNRITIRYCSFML